MHCIDYNMNLKISVRYKIPHSKIGKNVLDIHSLSELVIFIYVSLCSTKHAQCEVFVFIVNSEKHLSEVSQRCDF